VSLNPIMTITPRDVPAGKTPGEYRVQLKSTGGDVLHTYIGPATSDETATSFPSPPQGTYYLFGCKLDSEGAPLYDPVFCVVEVPAGAPGVPQTGVPESIRFVLA
jgi:hypothetical protein